MKKQIVTIAALFLLLAGCRSADTSGKFFAAESLDRLALAEVGRFWADDKPHVRKDRSADNFQHHPARLGGLRLRGKNKKIGVAVFRTQQDAIRAMEELRGSVALVIVPGEKHDRFPGRWWHASGLPNAVFVNHLNTIVTVSCRHPKYDKSKDMLIRTAVEIVDRMSEKAQKRSIQQKDALDKK